MHMDRVSFVMRVRDGFQDEYIRRHREVWPEVLAELSRAGVMKMGIFLRGEELFLYMEAQDYDRAVRMLNDSPAVIRWEEYMAPIMEDVAGKVFNPENAYPESLPEVFYWEPDIREPMSSVLAEGSDGDGKAGPHFMPQWQPPVRS
jgi:L-rhamnose mutarotase